MLEELWASEVKNATLSAPSHAWMFLHHQLSLRDVLSLFLVPPPLQTLRIVF